MHTSIHKVYKIRLGKIEEHEDRGRVFYCREIVISTQNKSERDSINLFAETKEELELKI